LACQPTSQQHCSLILNQHQPPAISQSAVLFSHNKSAPANSHSQANTAYIPSYKRLGETGLKDFDIDEVITCTAMLR